MTSFMFILCANYMTNRGVKVTMLTHGPLLCQSQLKEKS